VKAAAECRGLPGRSGSHRDLRRLLRHTWMALAHNHPRGRGTIDSRSGPAADEPGALGAPDLDRRSRSPGSRRRCPRWRRGARRSS
jgi:hypothetical protein